jgi:hypothetical protein
MIAAIEHWFPWVIAIATPLLIFSVPGWLQSWQEAKRG